MWSLNLLVALAFWWRKGSLINWVCTDIHIHIWIHTYLWTEFLFWRVKEIWYKWQNLILSVFLTASGGIYNTKNTWWSRLVYLGFSTLFKACSQNCCSDMGECWFLLITLQICTACSVPGKMPLWRHITAELPENSSVMGRGRREGGRKEGTKNKMSPQPPTRRHS